MKARNSRKRHIKKFFDLLFSLSLIIIFIPLALLIIILIKGEDFKSPLFFIQEVMGIDGTRFNMIKFRTMVPHKIDYSLRKDNSSKDCEVTLSDPRLTKIGKYLRRFKMDEMPQFVLVLIGKMSIVGPRPMDPVRYENSSGFQKQRLLMKPGITGLAQISGNTNFNWKERIEIDVWYIFNWSNRLDLEIIFMTIGVVLFGEHIKSNYKARKITEHNLAEINET